MRYGTGFAFLMAMLLSSSPVVKAEAYYYCDYYAECGGWDGDYCYDWWYDWDCGWYDDGGGGDPGGGGGSPEIPYAVELTEADIRENRVKVDLKPASMVTAKRLVVEAVRSDNSTTVLSDDNRAGGTHTFSFNSDSLPEGQYEYVRATWYLFGDPPNSSNPNSTRVVAFRALGTYRHSQYNTPWEGTCSAGPAQREVFSNAPPWSPSCSGLYVTQLRWDFAVQVETNGSGISNSVGYLHTVAGTSCNNQGAHFYNIPSITGSHGPVSDTTVAKVDSHAHLNYSDDVLIVGAPVNTKTVTDTCPGCTQTQLDNYNQGAACSARAFLDYGNFPTIRLR